MDELENKEILESIDEEFCDAGDIEEVEYEGENGVTSYGNGYDGKYRPIILLNVGHNCPKYTFDDIHFTFNGGDDCETCKYYSWNCEPKKRITRVSGWCCNDARIKGDDFLHPKKKKK